MLPCLYEYFHAKNQISQGADQRILQSNWKRDTSGHAQAKLVVSDDIFPYDLLNTKKQDIDEREIDEQRILQSNRIRDLTGHTQPKEVVSDATFHCLMNNSMQKIKDTEWC